MNESNKHGFSFGLTSAVITTLGLIIGLYSSTNSKTVVLAGIFTIAFADAFSDALGIHISEESEKGKTQKHVWQATFSTFFSKLFFALLFAVPFFIFSLRTAIVICVVFGILLLSLLSYKIAQWKKEKPFNVIFEHLAIAVIVLVVTYYVGIVVTYIA